MDTSVKTTIIILNWNGWENTQKCLESLAAVKEPPFDIIVVDNGSDDGSQEKLRDFVSGYTVHPTHLIENKKNLGFGAGNNIGMREALKNGAGFIVLLNNDTKVDAGFLQELVSSAQRHGTLGMLNPKILHMQNSAPTKRFWFIGGHVNWLYTRGMHRNFNEEDLGQFDEKEIIASDYATGCCLLVKRAVIEEIGLLPEDYFLYDEDTEWSLLARKKGWHCAVVPKAVVYHKGSASTHPGSPLYFRYHVRNGLLLSLRTGGLLRAQAAFFWAIPRAIWQGIKWLVFPEKRPVAKAILLGIQDAWLHRTGKIND